MQITQHADLPLHYGTVPPWLANRMSKLGRAIIEMMVAEYGKSEVMFRLSDPLWFQSFGAVLGMDWHSSGITTSVMGALKRSLNPISKQLGIYVCGGRGKHSRKTPQELLRVGDQTGMNGHYLARCSRLAAKVDNTAIQDGFQIYLHTFVVTDEGEWVVVQQGMNNRNGFARRYHWHSSQLEDFINDPHTWICGENQGLIFNLTDTKAGQTRNSVVDIAIQHPDTIRKEIRKIIMPAHHDVRMKDIDMKRLGSVIALAHESDLNQFEDLLLLKGLGPRTLQSLALVSEVIYGTPARFQDPARFSFAHGGKDGHPFPVPTKVYDEVIDTMDDIVRKSKIERSEKQKALQSLHKQVKQVEQNFVPNTRYHDWVEKEKADSPKYGGRTVFDDWPFAPGKKKPGRKLAARQLSLF